MNIFGIWAKADISTEDVARKSAGWGNRELQQLSYSNLTPPVYSREIENSASAASLEPILNIQYLVVV